MFGLFLCDSDEEGPQGSRYYGTDSPDRSAAILGEERPIKGLEYFYRKVRELV